jgi:hypothetical protein
MSTERGRVKHKYPQRKIAWDYISTLVRAGCTGQVAIDHIYTIYGVGTPVTTIINKLKQDQCTDNLHGSLGSKKL